MKENDGRKEIRKNANSPVSIFEQVFSHRFREDIVENRVSKAGPKISATCRKSLLPCFPSGCFSSDAIFLKSSHASQDLYTLSSMSFLITISPHYSLHIYPSL